jgi:cytochrome P450
MIAVDERGVPVPREVSQLPYLNAVIREALRLYAPLLTSEPRSSPVDTIVDGYHIPTEWYVTILSPS